MEVTPYEWTPTGLPCFRSQQAPPFLKTRDQLAELGLVPGGPHCALVDSSYDPARLYLITEATLAEPESWPPRRPAG